MAMPKAAVHEHDDSVLGKNDVGTTWELATFESKPESEPMKH